MSHSPVKTATKSGNSPNGAGVNDDGAESLKRALEAEREEQIGEQPAAEPIIPEVVPKPNSFVTQAIAQLVDRGLALSQKAGWSSPAAPPVLTEEKWKEVVSHSAAVVLARRFPRLTDEASEEFALLVFVGPWLVTNLLGMLWRAKKRPQQQPVNAESQETVQ